MPLPVGVLTRRITFGPPQNFAGEAIDAAVSFVPNTSLVHAASGTPIFAQPMSRNTDPLSGVGSIILPCTDQDGFTDGLGNAVTNWAYRVTWSFTNKQITAPTPEWIQVPTGDLSDLDLDLLIPVPTTGAIVVAVPIPPFLYVTTTPVTS